MFWNWCFQSWSRSKRHELVWWIIVIKISHRFLRSSLSLYLFGKDPEFLWPNYLPVCTVRGTARSDALRGILLFPPCSFLLPLPSEGCAAKPQLRLKQKQSTRGSVQPAVELRSSWLNQQICRVRERVEKLICRKQKINCIPVIILSKRVSPVDFLSSSHVALPDCEMSRVANRWWRDVGGWCMEVTYSWSSWDRRLLLVSSPRNRINTSELFLEAWAATKSFKNIYIFFFQTDATLSVSGGFCCSWLLRLWAVTLL